MQQEPPVTTVMEFIDWLNAGWDDAVHNAEELLRQPPDRWDAWLAGHATLSYHLVEEMRGQACNLLTDDAGRALAILELLVRHMDRVTVPQGREPFVPHLKAAAWTELGNAYGQTGALHDALAAYERSLALLEGDPLAVVDYELARRAAALTRHHLGERDDTLRIIREGIPLFEATAMTGEVLRSRMYEGWIEFEEGRPRNAVEIFTAALALAERREESKLIAQIHSNLGLCAQELGQADLAIEHLVLALKLFERQRMTAERPRAIQALAQVVKVRGRIDEAVLALRRAADDLSADGLPIDAALLWLDLFDLLLLTGAGPQQIAPVATELVPAFAEAEMEGEALQTLDRLQRAVAAGELNAEIIGSTRVALQATRTGGRV